MNGPPGPGWAPLRAEVGVRLEPVGKRYGLRQPWAVRDVSLDVPPGWLIRLEGPNGSGKSTLLPAEPDASRSCVAAAAGPARAQLATLLAALGGGLVLGAPGAVFPLLTSEPVRPHPQRGGVPLLAAAGLLAATWAGSALAATRREGSLG